MDASWSVYTGFRGQDLIMAFPGFKYFPFFTGFVGLDLHVFVLILQRFGQFADKQSSEIWKRDLLERGASHALWLLFQARNLMPNLCFGYCPVNPSEAYSFPLFNQKKWQLRGILMQYF